MDFLIQYFSLNEMAVCIFSAEISSLHRVCVGGNYITFNPTKTFTQPQNPGLRVQYPNAFLKSSLTTTNPMEPFDVFPF